MELEKDNNIIKQTCKMLGITQKELAERIGVSQNTISSWKHNYQIPDLAIKVFELLQYKNECDNYKKTVELMLFKR